MVTLKWSKWSIHRPPIRSTKKGVATMEWYRPIKYFRKGILLGIFPIIIDSPEY